MRISYKPLTVHLSRLSADGNHEWETSFSKIEEVLKTSLPDSARLHRPFWANTHQGASRAWVNIGWKSRKVNMIDKTLTFQYIGDKLDAKTLLKKTTKNFPAFKSTSKDGMTTEAAPMVSVDIATKQDIKTLGDDINSKMNSQKNEMDIQKSEMDIQKSEMDIQKSEMDIQHLELKQSILKYLIVASVCIIVVIGLLDYI